jgi:hypothetical protein
MHSCRRLLDKKELLLATCDHVSGHPLSPVEACITACGVVRWASGNPGLLETPQRTQEQRSAEGASVQKKSGTHNNVRVQQYPALQRLIQSLPRNDDRSAFPLGLYSAESGCEVTTIALQSGVNMAGHEMGMFQGAITSTLYPKCREEEQMYPRGVMEDIQMEVLRRNNISMPCKKNQRVYGTVYAVDRKRVWVDVGHTNLAQLSRSVRRLLIIANNRSILLFTTLVPSSTCRWGLCCRILVATCRSYLSRTY